MDWKGYTLLRYTYCVIIGLTALFQLLTCLLIFKVYRALKFTDKPQILSLVSILVSLSSKITCLMKTRRDVLGRSRLSDDV